MNFLMDRRKKKGEIMQRVLVHIILIGLLFMIFLTAMDNKIGSRGVKQQVLEKQLALLIDAADPEFTFKVKKKNIDGLVDSVKVKGGKIYVSVDGLVSGNGYPYFSRHEVSVEESEDKFIVRIT